MLVASARKSRLPLGSGSSAKTASSARSSSLGASIGPTSGTGKSGSSCSSSSGRSGSSCSSSSEPSDLSSSMPGIALSDDASSLSLDPKHWFMN